MNNEKLAMNLVEVDTDLTMVNEGHVGGFIIQKDPATYTPKLWKYICENFNIKSVLDIGCGMGHAIGEFNKYCDEVVGVDGSKYVVENSLFTEQIFYHDFAVGTLETEDRYDLCWSCEFVEHVNERYRDNFLEVFSYAKYLAITYAEPGQPGHHHVNCQPKEYWIEHLKRYGFEYDEKITSQLREVAYEDAIEINPKYKDNHFNLRGLFFIKK
jgi:SAM-dependent methyltransferase